MSDKKINPGRFIREVRQQLAKVIWPTRKETVATTGVVFVFVFVASIFFLLADQVFAYAVASLLRA